MPRPVPPPELFRHCPRCGEGPVEPGARPVFSCAACGLHLHFNPAVAAGVLVEDGEGRLLFIRRAREPARGRLGVPGGFVDAGETAEASARRETREETGLEVEEIAFLGSWPNVYEWRGVAYPVVDLYFTGRAREGSTASPRHEVEEVLWLRPAEVDPARLAFPTTRSAFARFCETRGILAPALFLALAASALAADTTPTADVLVANARVWTGDPARPEAEALAVIGERIVAVGSSAEIRAWRGPRTEVIDAGGRRVLPGFNDAHLHFFEASAKLAQVKLKDARSPEELARRVAEHARGLPEGEWVLKLTLAEAIAAYTAGSAHAEFQEREKGTLSPGRLADLVILSEDVFAIPPERIREVTVDTTMVGGRVVYRAPDEGASPAR